MAQVIVTESSLENIASAIRGKLNTQDTYKPSEMAGAISQIHGDPVLEALDVRANGTYTPSSGKDGFSQAVVNVPNTYTVSDEGKVVSSGALVAQSSQGINSNGTYDTTLKNQVVVNVPNSYSASDEGKVVDNGALVAQGSQTITQNGTYDTTLINQLIANISGGGGAKNILGGTTAPTSADGTDGDIYIKYIDYSSGGVLPSGYTAVDYLQSSGTQYIDTGVPARVQLKAEIDCQWLSSGDQTVLGGSSNVNNNAIYLGYNSTNNRTYVGYANSWHDFNSYAVNQTRHKWIIDLINNQQTMMVDDSQFATTSNSFSETTSTTNLFMFARSTGAAAFIGRIYNVKIYDYLDSGNLIRDFIPAKRNSDDALGMYDLVNDVFYINSGTGSFIGGTEVTGTPIDTVYLKVDGNWIILEDGDWDDVNTEGSGGEKGFELYEAGFYGGTQFFKGLLDNQYFVCFFHDNMQTYYDLNGVRSTYSYISSGYNCDLIGETKEVSNTPSTELHSILSHNGSSFTSYHKDSGSYCTLVGGWVGYPTGGTIYGNLANAITNSITMNSVHNKLLIFVAGSQQNMTQDTIDINGTSYTITNMGSQYDRMYDIYAAIEIENNTDTTITVTFPMQCWNFLSIVGLD